MIDLKISHDKTKQTLQEIMNSYDECDGELELLKLCTEKNKRLLGRLVATGDILKRDGESYEVIIADENIFVICRLRWSNKERSYITKYNHPEVYANQRDINTLEELGFKKI